MGKNPMRHAGNFSSFNAHRIFGVACSRCSVNIIVSLTGYVNILVT